MKTPKMVYYLWA